MGNKKIFVTLALSAVAAVALGLGLNAVTGKPRAWFTRGMSPASFSQVRAGKTR